MSSQSLEGSISIPDNFTLNPGTVTQITSNVTAVTLNNKAGLITMQAVLAAGGSFTFTLNNTFITTSNKILAWCSNTKGAVTFYTPSVVVGAFAAGSCTFTVSGDGTNATGNAPIIQFIIV